MANGFKKFIDTDGLPLDEIRKKVLKMVEGVAVDIVNDATELLPNDVRKKVRDRVRDSFKNDGEYKSEKIPEREIVGNNDSFRVTKLMPKPGVVIEYDQDEYDGFDDELSGKNKNLHYDDLLPENQGGQSADPEPVYIAYPHEAIIGEQSSQDEYMADKISQMRKLEEASHNGYIVKRCVEITMVRQGEFMKDVQDCYLHTAFCGIPRPIYAAMSRSQLRTYFTWRTLWRQGLHSNADKPYILLYCYEVLNKIGFDSSEAAFRELVLIHSELRGKAPYLDEVMPRWIKDFCAFNRVDAPLPELSEKSEKAGICRKLLCGDYKNKLEYLADNSSYNIRCSVFVDKNTKPLLDGACEAALNALDTHFQRFGVELSGLICGRMKKDHTWSPFGGALVDIERMDGFQPLEIEGLERYCKKRGEPALEVFEFAPSKDFIGYVLKSVEARLRIRVGFSHKLSPNVSMIKNELANRSKLQSAVADKDFEGLIMGVVDEYCRRNNITSYFKSGKKDDAPIDYSVPRVEIDISKLGEIREQAERNTKLLIVPDEVPSEDSVNSIREKIAEDEFSEAIADASESGSSHDDAEPDRSIGILTKDIFTITAPDNAGCAPPDFPSSLPKEWHEFAMDLIPDQIRLLLHMADGTLTEFCREHDILAQTAIEEINAVALTFIGDVIIEGEAFVEDYEDTLRSVLELFRRDE